MISFLFKKLIPPDDLNINLQNSDINEYDTPIRVMNQLTDGRYGRFRLTYSSLFVLGISTFIYSLFGPSETPIADVCSVVAFLCFGVWLVVYCSYVAVYVRLEAEVRRIIKSKRKKQKSEW